MPISSFIRGASPGCDRLIRAEKIGKDWERFNPPIPFAMSAPSALSASSRSRASLRVFPGLATVRELAPDGAV